jgi:hypothetical protein
MSTLPSSSARSRSRVNCPSLITQPPRGRRALSESPSVEIGTSSDRPKVETSASAAIAAWASASRLRRVPIRSGPVTVTRCLMSRLRALQTPRVRHELPAGSPLGESVRRTLGPRVGSRQI